jgi:6,7-dimethyl-8-ribityllumazine synthase
VRHGSRRQIKAAPSERRSARGMRIAILRALFNPRITDGLLAGAKAELVGLGADPRRLQGVRPARAPSSCRSRRAPRP